MTDHIKGFHIEPTNICTLKCPGCARTQFIDKWPRNWANHSLDIDKVLTFLDIDLTDKEILLCGNYGDPIYHPDFLNFVKQLKARGSQIAIITNGSYKKQEWWEELVGLLSSNDTITFSIDGVAENFTEYRINADWQSILTGMKVVAQANCHSVWKYIPFAFNQDSIEQAKKLSEDIGIKQFQIDPSDRFDKTTEHLIPVTDLLGPRYSQQTDWKAQKFNAGVNPKCHRQVEHFITAEGFYSPCCYVADHRFYYKTLFGKNKKDFNIKETTLSQILALEQTVDFYQNLETQPACQYSCPNTAG